MQRRTFLAGSLTGLSAGLLGPDLATAAPAAERTVDEDFLPLLTRANEAQIPLVLDSYRNAADSVRAVARKGRRLEPVVVPPRRGATRTVEGSRRPARRGPA
jgi:hypothetical protein